MLQDTMSLADQSTSMKIPFPEVFPISIMYADILASGTTYFSIIDPHW